MTRDGFSCFIDFQNFPEVFALGSKKTRLIFYYDEWAIILLAKDLLHRFQTIIFHNMDLFKDSGAIKILENLILICSLSLLEFQWNNLYFA